MNHGRNHQTSIRIHIDREDQTAKFWIAPVALASSIGFAPRELRHIQLLVIEHRLTLLEEWNGYFGA
jgi:hypothetical protein